jgi:hypothetical protein
MVDGGAGYDIVHVQGRAQDYKITNINGVIYIDSVPLQVPVFKTELINVEKIQFDDQSVDLTAGMNFVNHPGGEHFTGGAGIDQVSYGLSKSSYDVRVKAENCMLSLTTWEMGVLTFSQTLSV